MTASPRNPMARDPNDGASSASWRSVDAGAPSAAVQREVSASRRRCVHDPPTTTARPAPRVVRARSCRPGGGPGVRALRQLRARRATSSTSSTRAVDARRAVDDTVRRRLDDLSSDGARSSGPTGRRRARRGDGVPSRHAHLVAGRARGVRRRRQRRSSITGAKQRALLAMLALHPGQMVPADQLVEALWGDDPPPAVRNGLQGLVSKLRRLLGSAGADRDARRRLRARRASRTRWTRTASSSWSRRDVRRWPSGDLVRAVALLGRGRRAVAGTPPWPSSRTRTSPRARRLDGRSCASRRSRNGSMPSCSSVIRASSPSWRRWSPPIRSANGCAGC